MGNVQGDPPLINKYSRSALLKVEFDKILISYTLCSGPMTCNVMRNAFFGLFCSNVTNQHLVQDYET